MSFKSITLIALLSISMLAHAYNKNDKTTTFRLSYLCSAGQSDQTGLRSTLLCMAKLSDFVERLKDEIKSEYGDKKYKEWLSDIENSGGVTAGEEQKMFVAYVKSHPEKLKLNAYSTYKNVMLLAFPVESE